MGFKQKIRRYILGGRRPTLKKEAPKSPLLKFEEPDSRQIQLEDKIRVSQCCSSGPSEPNSVFIPNQSASTSCVHPSTLPSELGDTSTFCFLTFPPELRLEIYKHLIPTQDPWKFYKSHGSEGGGRTERPSLRHDSLPCSPALLYTCKKVYGELVEEFYSHAQFPVLIHSGGLSFFNNTYQNVIDSPVAFHIIKEMKITMVFHGGQEDELATSTQNQEATALLCALVASSSSLKKLEVQFALPEKFFSQFRGALDVAEFGTAVVRYFRLLARTVRAMREFRKATAARFTFRGPRWGAAPWHLDWLVYVTLGFLTAWINRTAGQAHLHWQTLLGGVEDEQHIAWGRCGFAHAWEVDWL